MSQSSLPDPPLNVPTAIAALIAYTLVYVLPFYLSPTTRPSATLTRDAPAVIRARIRSVVVSCLLCSTASFLVLRAAYDEDALSPSRSALHHLGYLPVGIVESAWSLLLTATLFLGPLFEVGFVEGSWRDWIRLRGLKDMLSSWIGWRNLVAGPVTEEILFRSASVPLLVLAHASNPTTIFLTPIIFGLAHAHHFYEFRLSHPHTPLVAAIARSVFQLAYTSLFGGYATFLYLRTGSLLAVILVHAFCNWMGLPRFWGAVRAGEAVLGPDYGEGKRDDGGWHGGHGGSMDGVWTVMYYILLVVGAVSWWKMLWVWTESPSALVSF